MEYVDLNNNLIDLTDDEKLVFLMKKLEEAVAIQDFELVDYYEEMIKQILEKNSNLKI